jgi:hypothetical protein
MPQQQRALSVGELAVHFGLEPTDIHGLLDRLAGGLADAELIAELQRLECSPAEARQLAAQLRQLAAAQRAPGATDLPSRPR